MVYTPTRKVIQSTASFSLPGTKPTCNLQTSGTSLDVRPGASCSHSVSTERDRHSIPTTDFGEVIVNLPALLTSDVRNWRVTGYSQADVIGQE